MIEAAAVCPALSKTPPIRKNHAAPEMLLTEKATAMPVNKLVSSPPI